MVSVKISGEVRIPNVLLAEALAQKKVKQLRLFSCAKLNGHKCEISALADALKIHPKTCKRLVASIVNEGWAGTDGKYLYPRAWRKLKLNKRGGLYLTDAPKDAKKFEALCFAKALKKLYRKLEGQRLTKGKTEQNDLPARYIFKSLGISERRFHRLKALAQDKKYRFISVKQQYKIVGSAEDFIRFRAMKKHLHGIPFFIRGKHCVVPDVSKIRVLI
jgi:hypothetical protein